jgi:hypothetical protein
VVVVVKNESVVGVVDVEFVVAVVEDAAVADE